MLIGLRAKEADCAEVVPPPTLADFSAMQLWRRCRLDDSAKVENSLSRLIRCTNYRRSYRHAQRDWPGAESASFLGGMKMNMLNPLRVLDFPSVTRDEAQRIASGALAQTVTSALLICHSRKPDNFHIYADLPEPCWYVQAPWDDESTNLSIRSSRVIVIGRRTGAIFYDGSAYDEG